MSNLSATSNYSNSATPGNPANSNALEQAQDPFLAEVTVTRELLVNMSSYIENIKNLHKRALDSPDSSSSTAELEGLVTETQVNNGTIRDKIKYLQADAVNSKSEWKKKQANLLRDSFQQKLTEYNVQEEHFRKEYGQQFQRQYKIVYPNASQTEVEEALEQNWSNEGVFQQAVSIRNMKRYTTFCSPRTDYVVAQRQHPLKTSSCSCGCRSCSPQ
jgi:syntaxin 1B/2/3